MLNKKKPLIEPGLPSYCLNAHLEFFIQVMKFVMQMSVVIHKVLTLPVSELTLVSWRHVKSGTDQPEWDTKRGLYFYFFFGGGGDYFGVKIYKILRAKHYFFLPFPDFAKFIIPLFLSHLHNMAGRGIREVDSGEDTLMLGASSTPLPSPFPLYLNTPLQEPDLHQRMD